MERICSKCGEKEYCKDHVWIKHEETITKEIIPPKPQTDKYFEESGVYDVYTETWYSCNKCGAKKYS
jgi:hypothetical protein